MIKLLCKNRQIVRTDNQWVVELSRNVDPISVTFDEEWNDLNISITFRNGEIGPHTVDFVEGMKIPPQFLETGEINISFTGRKLIDNDDMEILRTGEMKYPIKCHKAGDAISMPPPDLPPDIWEQAIVKVDEALKNSQEAITKADEAVTIAQNALVIAQEVRAEFERFKDKTIPDGGVKGQVLGKLSSENNDVGWIDQTGGGTSKWEFIVNKPFDTINQSEMEVVGQPSDMRLGIRQIDQSKVTGLSDKLNNIDSELNNKQPSGNYATREELSQGLVGKQDAGDYATNAQLSSGLSSKQDKGNYATKEELEDSLANKQDKGDYATKSEIPDKLPNPSAITFTGKVSATYDGSSPVEINIPEGGSGGTSRHNELTEESRWLPDQHPISAIVGLSDSLSDKKPMPLVVTVDPPNLTSHTSQQIAEAYAENRDIELIDRYGGGTYTLVYVSAERIAWLQESITRNAVGFRRVEVLGNKSTYDMGSYKPSMSAITGLNDALTEKLNKAGHTPNKNLVTDASGNVVEEEKPTIPTKLPNPNSITFTGAATGSYDGSAPLEINIPNSGGSKETPWVELINKRIVIPEKVTEINETIPDTHVYNEMAYYLYYGDNAGLTGDHIYKHIDINVNEKTLPVYNKDTRGYNQATAGYLWDCNLASGNGNPIWPCIVSFNNTKGENSGDISGDVTNGTTDKTITLFTKSRNLKLAPLGKVKIYIPPTFFDKDPVFPRYFVLRIYGRGVAK